MERASSAGSVPSTSSGKTKYRRPDRGVGAVAGSANRLIPRRPNDRSSSPPLPKVADRYSRCRAPANSEFSQVGGMIGLMRIPL